MALSPDDYNLKEIDKAALKILAEACNYSLYAHLPEQAILRKAPKNLQEDIKKSLHKLHKKGLSITHPTRGSTTYDISREGLRLARMF